MSPLFTRHRVTPFRAALTCCLLSAALPAIAELQNVEVSSHIGVRPNWHNLLEGPGIDINLNFEPGTDGGQGLGSLFELKNAAGKVVLGAGFDDAHSTYMRDNNRQVIFYHRSAEPKPEITHLGKPFDSEHNGTRLLVDGEDLLTFFRHGNAVAFRTPAPNGEWHTFVVPWGKGRNAFCGMQQVNNKPLHFYSDRITYDGAEIYTTERGGGRYFYDKGRLFIYHSQPDQLLVTPWKPGETIDMDQVETHDLVGVVFTWGTYNDEFLLTTNVGEFYSYRDGALTRIRATDGTSWQGYSMLRHYDAVLIGHYPTGSLYQYDDKGLALFDPPIPVLEGVSVSAREAQTLAIHGGYLYAGLWPWGEIWRFDHEARQWHFVERVFQQPELSAEDQEPYARAMADKPAPYNLWGQRIKNLTNYRDGLYIATMNKGGNPWLPEVHDFLDEATVAQYGAVHRLTAPTQIAAPFTWKDRTALRFRVTGDALYVFQDGELLGSAKLPPEAGLLDLSQDGLTLGKGIYGPSRGTVTLDSFTVHNP